MQSSDAIDNHLFNFARTLQTPQLGVSPDYSLRFEQIKNHLLVEDSIEDLVNIDETRLLQYQKHLLKKDVSKHSVERGETRGGDRNRDPDTLALRFFADEVIAKRKTHYKNAASVYSGRRRVIKSLTPDQNAVVLKGDPVEVKVLINELGTAKARYNVSTS